MTQDQDAAAVAKKLTPNQRVELLKFKPGWRRSATRHSTACLFAKAAKLGVIYKEHGYPVGYELTKLGEAVRAHLQEEGWA